MPSLNSVFRLQDKYTAAINKIINSSDSAAEKIKKASMASDEFSDGLKSMGSSADKASGGLGKLIKTVVTLAAAQKSMSIADEYTNTAARLNLINDGLQNNLQLQQAIFKAADNSRGSYSSMADAVSKLGLNAADAFDSTGEIVSFTELLQKSFKVGGASSSEQSAAMLQLTQAMGSGKLQGDEFRSIMENAPMLADAIANYMGKSKGELKELSSEGLITSDIIKAAVFSAGDDINEKFAEMPVTFADVGNKIKNHALQSFGPVIEKITQFLNTDDFMEFIDRVGGGINTIVSIVGWAVGFIVGNLDVIIPILLGIAAIYGAVMIPRLWATIPPLLASAAAWALNHLAFLAIVAVIVIVLIALNKLGIGFSDVCGFIGGIIGVMVTGIYNQFVLVWNFIANFVNFFANVFKDPVASVKILFWSMCEDILGFLRTLIQGIEDMINLIPGVKVDLTSGLDGVISGIGDKVATIKSESEWEEVVKKKDFVDFSDGFAKGNEFGTKVGNKIESAISGITDMVDDGFSFNTEDYSGDPIPVSGVDGSSVKVNIADEDLKYLKDIAERDYIAKVAQNTLAPNVQITFGDVHETADAEQLAGRISKILEEEISISAEGVYA